MQTQYCLSFYNPNKYAVTFTSQYQFSSKLMTILNFAMKYVYKPVFFMTWTDRYCEDLCKSHMVFYQNELRFVSHTVYDPKLTLIWLSQRNFIQCHPFTLVHNMQNKYSSFKICRGLTGKGLFYSMKMSIPFILRDLLLILFTTCPQHLCPSKKVTHVTKLENCKIITGLQVFYQLNTLSNA